MEAVSPRIRREGMLLGTNVITWYLKKKGQVTIPGFGKFYLSAIKVPAVVAGEGDVGKKEVLAIRFKPSAKLKGAINGR